MILESLSYPIQSSLIWDTLWELFNGQLTVDPLQYPPGCHLGGLWPDAVDSLRAKSQEEDEDYCDQEGGEQQSGHNDDLLLVHPDLWQAATTGTIFTHTSGMQSVCARLSTSSIDYYENYIFFWEN